MSYRNLLFWGRRVAWPAILAMILTSAAVSQPRYRTFSQTDLAMKKVKAGKVTGSTVSFSFTNPRLTPVHGFHAIIGKKIIAVLDSGGFPNWKITDKRVIDATGLSVPGGESISITLLVNNRNPGTVVNYFWWTDEAGDRRTSTEMKLPALTDEQHYTQPNGGNIRHYMHKHVVLKPEGLVLGIPDVKGRGYVRYTSTTAQAFPAHGEPRCLDQIVTSSGRSSPIDKQMRNLRVKKYNNHLLGELHALKLAIRANDAGITEPDPSEHTRLGDLLYSDQNNIADPLNEMTIREIAAHADSALTFCGKHTPEYYFALDSVISKINLQFGGEYVAVSFDPFLLAGGSKLADAEYLHPNPNPPPAIAKPINPSIVEATPTAYGLAQNYPNPFNPTTTIEFTLPEASVVHLRVYDMLGREVAALIDGAELDEGTESVEFAPDGFPSGVYFYKLTAVGIDNPESRHQETKSMFLVK